MTVTPISKITERNVQQIGKSLLITLPKQWARTFNIKKGQKLKLLTSEQGNLMIAPEFVEKLERKETSIEFDQYFHRKFFREYFEGNDKITIDFKPNENKKDLYEFLKRFMNVQVIEETEKRLVVRCFKIEDLSIEECMKRMYYLSIGLFDENKVSDIKEIRDTMTRFYYMLVMQVRRFLSEGKFTKENQISLIRALDFRMVAEKIQRVTLKLIELKEPSDDLEKIKELYSKSILLFLASDYEKAIPLWKEIRDEMNKLEKIKDKQLKGTVQTYNKTLILYEILNYAKEISMLIR